MIRAAVVGATGIVGQQFLVALKGHPWIEVKALAASERSAGQSYRKAITDPATGAVRWFCDEPPVEDVMDMPVVNATELSTKGIDLVFSAIESGPAKTLEPQYAAEVPVITTASAFRYEDDVPILIPGVNPGHARLIAVQRKRRGWKGFITPNPNCTTIGLAITLKPLYDAFGAQRGDDDLDAGHVGRGPLARRHRAGHHGQRHSLHPRARRRRSSARRRRSSASSRAMRFDPPPFAVSCTCTRVCVLEGHTEAVFVRAHGSRPRWRRSQGDEGVRRGAWRDCLPLRRTSSHVSDDPFRPQPRLDRDTEGGMATTVGRLRQDAALPNGIKYVLVSHNTKMGAARGAVLEAEMLIHDGYIG